MAETKPMKPVTAAAPAAPDVPVECTCGGGGGGGGGGAGGGGRCEADAVVGKDVVRARAHMTVAAVVRKIPVVVLCRLLTGLLTTNDFMGESPKKFFS